MDGPNVAVDKSRQHEQGGGKLVSVHSSSRAIRSIRATRSSRPATPPKPSPPVESKKQPGLDEDFQLGDFTYNVKRVTSYATIGSGFAKKRASEGALFVVVEYTILNESNATKTVLADDFRIADSQKREFRPSSEANTSLMMSGETKDFVISEVQPGIKKKMQTAFEMPEASVMGSGGSRPSSRSGADLTKNDLAHLGRRKHNRLVRG